tara:strand:- start:382 stop:582 length:201 start_codon:yes stop_codon:yes gene_type:complete
MKNKRFEVGDLISSQCGDSGVVLEIGTRPDDDGTGKIGVYVLWAKEGLSFWMNLDEPTIQLNTECN